MSEELAVALLSGSLLIMTGVLGWVATELRQIHHSLLRFVDKTECREDMGRHCDRLDALDRRVQKNAFVLSTITQHLHSSGQPLADTNLMD